MASPQSTYNAAGNIASAVALAAGASGSQFTIDASAFFMLEIQVSVTAGATVAATNGLTVNIYRSLGLVGTPVTDSIPCTSYQLSPLTASTTMTKSINLSTGRYVIQVVNADATNGVTYSITTAEVTGIA